MKNGQGNSPIDKVFAPSRRSVLRGAAGLSALGLAGGLSSVIPAKAAAQMNYMCWEGYDSEDILGPFKATNDVAISVDLITDSAGGFAKLASGGYRNFDVVSTDSPWVQRMC